MFDENFGKIEKSLKIAKIYTKAWNFKKKNRKNQEKIQKSIDCSKFS